MTIDWDKPIQLRDGREVRVYTHNGGNHDYPVVGEYQNYYDHNYWNVRRWKADGKTSPVEKGIDIINKPPVKTFKYRPVFTNGGIGLLRKQKESAEEYHRRCGLRIIGHLYYEYLDGKLSDITFVPSEK